MQILPKIIHGVAIKQVHRRIASHPCTTAQTNATHLFLTLKTSGMSGMECHILQCNLLKTESESICFKKYLTTSQTELQLQLSNSLTLFLEQLFLQSQPISKSPVHFYASPKVNKDHIWVSLCQALIWFGWPHHITCQCH